MKSHRSSWKVCLAAILGFVAGVTLFHSRTVSAQYGGSVTVQQFPALGIRSTMNPTGSQIVGFSCAQTDSGPECYLASR
jgi:hypothetical protein